MIKKPEVLGEEKIENWLRNRLGEGNVFEQFNRGFCKDLAEVASHDTHKKDCRMFLEWLSKHGKFHYSVSDEEGMGVIILPEDYQEFKDYVGGL